MLITLKKFTVFLLWSLSALMLSWLLLQGFAGDAFWPVRFLTYAHPWLMLAGLLSLAVSLLARRWLLVLVLLVLCGFYVPPYFSRFYPAARQVPAGETLKVMTYSVMGRNDNYDAMARVFAQHQPDLAFFQEVGLPALKERLQKISGDREIFFQSTNVGFIASRYPLQLIERSRPYTRVEMTWPAGTVTLWNVHADKALKNYKQYEQVSTLLRDVKAVTGARIVAGDFNSTQMAEIYRMVGRDLTNAHEQAGRGFGFTFPTPARRIGSLIPFLRIDHIFYSDDFIALDSEVGDNAGGSDHLPVLATLGLTGTKKNTEP